MYFDLPKKQKQIHRTIGNKIDVLKPMMHFDGNIAIETKKLAKTYYGDFGKSQLMLFCQWIYKWVKEKHLVLSVLMGQEKQQQ